MTLGNYRLENVCGHIEVYDASGRFVLSADDAADAKREIEALLSESACA